MPGVDSAALARFTGQVQGERACTRRAIYAERARVETDARVSGNAGTAVSATHALEQKAVALEERSRSLTSENEHLQDRLGLALSEIEDIVRANKALRACLLEVQRAGAADANTLRASLLKAATATEAAAGVVAAAAAEVQVAAKVAKAGVKGEVDSTNHMNTKAREVAVAAAKLERQVGRLDENTTCLREIARKMTSKTLRQLAARMEEDAAVAEESNTRVSRSREWEGEAARLAGELEASKERAVNAQRELEAAMAMSRELVAGRRVLEVEAAASRRRETELREELEASQAAVRTLTSTAGEAARSSDAALDDMRDSLMKVQASFREMTTERDAAVLPLLEVTQARATSVQLLQFPVDGEGKEAEDTAGQAGDCSGRDGGEERSFFSEQMSRPHSAAARQDSNQPQVEGLIRVPYNHEDDEDDVGIDSHRWSRTSRQTVPLSSEVGAEASRLQETDVDGEAWSGVGRHSIRSSDEIGEHVCRVCGARIPSFGKLVDCRLSLDRTREELGEARARITELEEGNIVHAGAGATTEALRRDTTTMVESAATRNGENQAVADLTALQEEEADAYQTSRDSFAEESFSFSHSQKRVRELELEVRRLVSLLEAADRKIEPHALSDQNEVEIHGRFHLRRDVNDSIGAKSGGGRGNKRPTDEKNDVDDCGYNGGGSTLLQERSADQTMGIRGGHETLTESRGCELCGKDGTGREDARVMASAGTVRTRKTMERDQTRNIVIALEQSSQDAGEETEHLQRRVRRMRVALREAERRGNDMEANCFEADAAASAASTALAVARAEANRAMATRHEVEEKAFSAERQHRSKVETLEVELSRATASAIEAREQCKMAQGEILRLRQTTSDSDQRVASLEKRLAFLADTVLDADAGRVHALLERVQDLAGCGREGKGRGIQDCTRHTSTNVHVGSTPAQDQQICVRTDFSSSWPLDSSVSSSNGGGSGNGLIESTALRSRLAASRAHHVELVRASEEAVARCNQRCEARVGAALAAGRLVAARSHQHGIASGREMALEAANRLALVKRCFRALREEALLRSRDRSVRRQNRMKIWIGDAFERAGEELLVMAQRKHLQKQN